MATKNQAEGVYRVIDVIGTSATSWEDAAKTAVETASKSLVTCGSLRSPRWT